VENRVGSLDSWAVKIKKEASSTRSCGRKSGNVVEVVCNERVDDRMSFLNWGCGIEGFWKTGSEAG
jgi:hypothetical protein